MWWWAQTTIQRPRLLFPDLNPCQMAQNLGPHLCQCCHGCQEWACWEMSIKVRPAVSTQSAEMVYTRFFNSSKRLFPTQISLVALRNSQLMCHVWILLLQATLLEGFNIGNIKKIYISRHLSKIAVKINSVQRYSVWPLMPAIQHSHKEWCVLKPLPVMNPRADW